MNILGIDPGTTESAYVQLHDGKIISFAKVPNHELLGLLPCLNTSITVVCEMIASYGMPVGRETFETCLWIGRFWQASLAAELRFERVYRRDVKVHLCGNMRAKDPNVRQVLLDRFGPPGTKKAPGQTYGIKADIWAALGVAVTGMETILKR